MTNNIQRALHMRRTRERLRALRGPRRHRALTREHQQRAARAAAKIAVSSGQIEALGRRNASTGFLASIKTPESLANGGRAAGHKRWHVDRKVTSAKCMYCISKVDCIWQQMGAELFQPFKSTKFKRKRSILVKNVVGVRALVSGGSGHGPLTV